MLSFSDLFPQLRDCPKDYKVHLATFSGTDPLDEFINDKFKEWQERQSKRNFRRKYIISFIAFERDEWLFAGIYKTLGCNRINKYFDYDTQLIESNNDLIGRLIIRYKRPSRQSYPFLENCMKDFQISRILKEKYSLEEFPGYDNTIVDYSKLQTIIRNCYPTWYTALKNIKGVYLITDKTNGKHYIGSASGEEAFWSRWTDYVRNGHGDNEELKKVISEKGIKYAQNFQFSILEISSKTDRNDILKREEHWKKALMTREYGSNKN